MSVHIDSLPRDENGIVQGVWRVLHSDHHYNGPVGLVSVEHGIGQQPLCGRQLLIAVAMYGNDIYLERWTGPTPDGFVLPPLVEFDAPGFVPDPRPWRSAPALLETLPPPPPEEPTEAAAPADALEDLDRDALEALATQLGVAFDGRTGDKRLRKAIRQAQA